MHHHNHWDNFEIFYWMFKLSILLRLFWFEYRIILTLTFFLSFLLLICQNVYRSVGRAGKNKRTIHLSTVIKAICISMDDTHNSWIRSIDGCTTSACAHLVMDVCEFVSAECEWDGFVLHLPFIYITWCSINPYDMSQCWREWFLIKSTDAHDFHWPFSTIFKHLHRN